MLLARGSREHSSVSIARTTAGSITVDVTVKTGESEDVQTVEDAEAKAVEVFARIVALFPEPEPHDAAEVSFTRNAKGETQVSASGKTTSHGLRTLPELEAHVRKVYDAARGKYPMADGLTAKPGSVS